MNPMPESSSVIRIAAALLIGRGGRIRLVRKRGTLACMRSGEKISYSEEPICTFVQELRHVGEPAGRRPTVLVGETREVFRLGREPFAAMAT